MINVPQELGDVVETLISAILKPATFLYDPSKRVFWGYLIVALVIAGLVLVVRDRRQWRFRLYEQLLSPRLWLHPSSLLDMKLMVTKSVVRALLFAPWLLSSYGVALAVLRLANGQLGVAHPTTLSPSWIALLYTVVLFMSSDGSRYLLHRLCHEVPLLWQFHQVHHSAQVMTPLTLYRSHPVENLLFVLRGVLVTGFVTGVFFYIFGEYAVQYQFLGVNALGLLFNMLGANLRHSPVWISYGSRVEHFLLSPAQHQIHHSEDPEHFGSNYGSCLALWDWLGGSLRIAKSRGGLSFGLARREANHNPHILGSALIGPFRGCWRLIVRRSRGAWAFIFTYLKF